MVEANAWAGVPGVSSPLHYDAAHNTYLQLTGHKRFLLVPAEQALTLSLRLRPPLPLTPTLTLS